VAGAAGCATRFTLHIALHFFLPGIIGLASQLAEGADDGGLFWRIATCLAAAVGLLESLTLRRPDPAVPPPPGWRLRLVDPPAYAAMLVVAVLPPGLTTYAPLQLAGAVTGFLFLIGLCLAWLAFAEAEAEPEVEPEPEPANQPTPTPVPAPDGAGDRTARVDLPHLPPAPRPRPGCRFSSACRSSPTSAPAIRCPTCPASVRP
jgi:hypothetical protein